jgi:CpeT protein
MMDASLDSVPDIATETQTDAPVEATVDASDPLGISRTLYRYLLGRFDSGNQAVADSTYFNITVQTCRVSVPSLGAQVLYIEQARAGMTPYRQRLYVVEAREPSATRAVSRVFEFTGMNSTYVGLCNDPTRLTIKASDVVERAGCAVEVTWMTDHFEGGTVERNCESSLMGASYATSEVILRTNGFTSWDRGYNSAGMQVWGAIAGPYRFVRRSMIEPE